jgi:predicted naringenin-chalcone synthase
MVLSGQVPRLVGAHVRDALIPLLGPGGDGYPGVDRWACTPAGAASSTGSRPRWVWGRPAGAVPEVLRRYGNMSSATVLFVLAPCCTSATGAGRSVCALAFGPG